MKILRMFAVAAVLAFPAGSFAGPETLAEGFVDPPAEARPWVYWFWLNGNITREGITADLEAMARAGIGGVLIMEVDQGVPVGPVPFMGDEWRALFGHVLREADRLGLQVNMNNDAGWNGSGGPWIRPAQAMQKVVWTEAAVAGPGPVSQLLPQPETIAGHYRDIAVFAVPAVGGYRIENIAAKSCLQTNFVMPGVVGGDAPEDMRVPPETISDLSGNMDDSGRLVWDAPPGNWTVLRMGHTCTGVENMPSPASGRGLECDKLSREGIDAQWAGMMGPLVADAGPLAGKALAATHIDSWENGAQNWTPRMRDEFQKRRGYDLFPWLPVMTGRVVGSLELSERFLWDLRRTVADLVEENYAGRLKELAAEHGLRLTIEAYGGPCDDQPYAGRCDEPMGEFWIGGSALTTCRAMASAAHTRGMRIVGAEAFTAGDHEKWQEHPGSIKPLGDRAFCEGINRFVFHRYALQPWADRRPGMTMGPWGIHYERTQTWWEWTPAWHKYLTRCQHLLRQGLFAADICHVQPEAAPQGFQEHPRAGYDYDVCGADVVLRDMSVRGGRLVLPDGMSYRVLALSGVDVMTPELLRKVGELAKAGATIIGPKPVKSPSLSNYPGCDSEVARLAAEIWGDCDGRAVKERRHGAGRVVWGITPEGLLARDGVPPDFLTHARLNWIHRVNGDTDFWFVANPHGYPVAESCAFRVAGKRPELWHPDTGAMEPAAAFLETDGVTRVPLSLPPGGSVFVLFSPAPAGADSVAVLARNGEQLFTAASTGPKVEIVRAVYGVQGDAAKCRDVRAEVQRRVDAGEYALRVAALAEEGDPADGSYKTLVVEYTLDGKPLSVSGGDNDMVWLSNDCPPIRIERARYGVLDDPARTRDVREKLQRLVDTGETSFQIARMAAGDDPAVMVTKTLDAEYTVDGKSHTLRGIDSETVTLAPPPPPREEPAELRVAPGGGTVLAARSPGTYQATLASGKQVRVDADPGAPVEIAGPWRVRFAPGGGAPEEVTLDTLLSWSEHADPGVQHYSGEAVYTVSFTLPGGFADANREWRLDLGDVRVMARVAVNGKDFGVLWKRPFHTDVTAALKEGENTLEVRVVNLWVNRLIGDERLPEDGRRYPEGNLAEWPGWLLKGDPIPAGRHTFTTWRLWRDGDPLQPSGLLGPVALRPVELKPLPE